MYPVSGVAEPLAAGDCYHQQEGGGVKPLADKFGEGGVLLVFTRHPEALCARLPCQEGPFQTGSARGIHSKSDWGDPGLTVPKRREIFSLCKEILFLLCLQEHKFIEIPELIRHLQI